MPLEAEQYIPFDIEEVNLDFHILGESTNTPDNMQVLLVAVKKDMIEGYVQLVEDAGLHPCVVDIDAFALQNIYETAYHDAQEQHVALIDIGAGKTSLIILQKGGAWFMRDISSGCGQINRKIMSENGCSAEEAEAIKLGNTDGKPFPGKLDEMVTSVVTDWCMEINHALDIYYSTYTDNRIERIYLSGGGAHLQILYTLLARQTETEVKKLNPFRNLRFVDPAIDSEYLQRVAAQAAICMGLSLRRVDDK
jgi:type IV pilus assembly protein PilM